MVGNKKKIFKGIVTLILILVVLIMMVRGIYSKFYLNGNNINNIKRSILNIQDKDMSDFENISVIKTIEINEELFVVYKNEFDCGVAEFSKNKYGNYEINYLEHGNLAEINFHLTSGMKNNNQYFIVYGDGNNIDFSRVDIGINNNYVPINIPKDVFIEIIKINQYFDGDSYQYNYKYYDIYGNVVEEY